MKQTLVIEWGEWMRSIGTIENQLGCSVKKSFMGDKITEMKNDIEELIEILDECYESGVRTDHHEIKERYK